MLKNMQLDYWGWFCMQSACDCIKFDNLRMCLGEKVYTFKTNLKKKQTLKRKTYFVRMSFVYVIIVNINSGIKSFQCIHFAKKVWITFNHRRVKFTQNLIFSASVLK